jgi:hypothetical protein
VKEGKVSGGSKKTVAGRRALMAARREAARDRDAVRYSLAEELGRAARLTIPPDQGFLVRPPGDLQSAGDVVTAANELIGEIGPDELMHGQTKEGFLALKFLPPAAFQVDSPFMRFALDEEVLGPVASYLGCVPVLHRIDLWYSFHLPQAPTSSQLWHLDRDDTTQVKVWVHCSDVDRAAGPLTVIDAAASDLLAERVGYDYGEGYRVPDEQVRDVIGDGGPTAFEGPVGTVDFVDTSRCFHFGSRVAQDGVPRRVFHAQYLTPYAFKFKADFREKAPYRDQVSADSSELERLLLGAD